MQDAELAEEFVDTYCDEIRYDVDDECWYRFDGALWRRDNIGQTARLMHDLMRTHDLGSARKLDNALRLARIDPRIAVTCDVWDQDPYLLGTPRAVIDLRTSRQLTPSPTHMVTLSTAVAPINAPPTQWLTFLTQATRGDTAYVRYLRSLCGYCMTGVVNYEQFWFVYGDGGGGKGVFLDTFSAALGTYGWKAASRTLLASKTERHLTELASFQRKRFVYISETPAGRAWDAARLKELTGGDPINANRMHADPFTFQPTHKLLAMGNHAPTLSHIDNSVRRRLRILPFDNIVTDDQRDVGLKRRLRDETPMILSWAIQGAAEVLTAGLDEPDVVRAASANYLDANDVFGEWISERCIRGPRHEERSIVLLQSWNAHRKDRGEAPETAPTFRERMERVGFEKFKKSEMFWRGLTLTGER